MIPWLARSRAWTSLLFLVPLGAISVCSKPLAPLSSWADFGFDALGGTLFGIGVFVRWWATLYIGGRKTHELVCDGPYSICRNPIYWGTFLLTMAAAILLQSVSLTIGVVLVSVIYFTTTVGVEEEKLQQRHGRAFVEYCQSVPRFFPRFNRYKSPPVLDLKLDGVRAEFRRSLRYVWLPIGCHLVAHLRAETWWPDFHCLP